MTKTTDGEASGRLDTLLAEHRADDAEALVHVGDVTITAGQLRRSVTELSEMLSAAGVRPGQPVAALATNTVDTIAAMFGVWSAGAVYVPLNPRLSTAELNHVLTESPVAAVIGASADLARLDVPSASVISDGALGWHMSGSVPPDVEPTDPDVALIMRTSGTTGASKAVELRHDGTLEGLRTVVQKLTGSGTARRASTPNLIPVSLALWAGIYNILFAFSVHAAVVLLPTFSTNGLADVVRRFQIKSTVLAPAMMQMLATDDSITDLSPLRYVRSITAPLSPANARRFFERFGVFVLNSYGQTELGGEVVGWTARDVREFGDAKLGAVGRPHEGISVRILDPDGRELTSGEPGEVWVRSPFLMRGYANGELSERMVDGYLRTGDVGHLDDDGFLWIDGRVSDMINRGGLKVVPDEVEQVLARHPAVDDACVAGVDDARVGEVPVAWIVSRDEFDGVELERWCRNQLAAYKVPVEFVRVDALPRNEIGKVLRRSLVESHRPS